MPQLVPQLLPVFMMLALSTPMTPVSADDSHGSAGWGTIALATQDRWKVGDRIEAYNVGWYNATITQIGSGRNDGAFMVHWDNYSTDQWIAAKNIRARQGADKSPTKADVSKAAAMWKAGDKVLAYNVGWYPATVLAIGTGNYAGYIMVHFDASTSASNQYVSATNIKARPDERAVAAAAATDHVAGPRLGRYLILSYGRASAAPLQLGEVELLAGGRYRVGLPGGRANGEGRYDYDGTAGTVRWLSGRYKDEGWGGEFTVEREGKTHRIQLKRGTIAVNSTDG